MREVGFEIVAFVLIRCNAHFSTIESQRMRLLILTVVIFTNGCQSTQVKQQRLSLVEQADDVVLCYSLIDSSFQLDQKMVLSELKRRGIDSCLATIASHECPSEMDSRQDCLDKTKVRIAGELNASQSPGGTELLIKGVQIGIGVLPF